MVGGHREEVLKRDGYRCRVPECTTVKRGKRSVAVHHRQPGNSDPARMLTLCLACHAKVTRTLFVEADWPDFLRVLWREQHPDGHEQRVLNFACLDPASSDQLPFRSSDDLYFAPSGSSKSAAVTGSYNSSHCDKMLKSNAAE